MAGQILRPSGAPVGQSVGRLSCRSGQGDMERSQGFTFDARLEIRQSFCFCVGYGRGDLPVGNGLVNLCAQSVKDQRIAREVQEEDADSGRRCISYTKHSQMVSLKLFCLMWKK